MEASRQRGKQFRAMRRRTAIMGLAVAALSWTILVPPAPRLLWNASASAPIGLYRVEPDKVPDRGDWAIAWPPSDIRSLAASRHYLPTGVPLVKRVAAHSYDTVCAVGPVITVNGLRRRCAEMSMVTDGNFPSGRAVSILGRRAFPAHG
jgi:type IV secretory pathway protease TraF